MPTAAVVVPNGLSHTEFITIIIIVVIVCRCAPNNAVALEHSYSLCEIIILLSLGFLFTYYKIIIARFV